MSRLSLVLAAGAFLAAGAPTAHAPAAARQAGVKALNEQDRAAVARADRETAITDLLSDLQKRAVTGLIAITDVGVVDPVKSTTTPGQTVMVRDGRIVWVGPKAMAPSPAGAFRIDGRGRFLSPGLVNSHVHTYGAASRLMHLATGVTTVREMVGFPWQLELRARMSAGRVLGPTTYVAGTIIADQPMDEYAVVVKTPDDARKLVRAQAACGYDFIKVHNSLAEPLFDAVADEAAAADMDLVGHIPHAIAIDHAVHAARMRTLEHLKGFIDDRDFSVSPEDFAGAMAKADVWLTPTLVTRQQYLQGAAAAPRLDPARMRYLTPAQRERWVRFAATPDARTERLGRTWGASQEVVMRRLVAAHPRWLVGTDSEYYAYGVYGLDLLDELDAMRDAGIPSAEVLAAATREPAVAFRRPGEFGLIERGMRADLVLLEADPTRDPSAFRRNAGVMAAGRWFDRPALDASLQALAAVYARPEAAVSRGSATALAHGLEIAVARGEVFEPSVLDRAAAALTRAGYETAGRRIAALATRSGACAPL